VKREAPRTGPSRCTQVLRQLSGRGRPVITMARTIPFVVTMPASMTRALLTWVSQMNNASRSAAPTGFIR
jgi:hypothetical protein